ncbi:hypothetical protein BS78_07G105800 [Paspalum vaginatum]|nr:hypothetical protein BS78_07G105800 [Paspalum vaginatum]
MFQQHLVLVVSACYEGGLETATLMAGVIRGMGWCGGPARLRPLRMAASEPCTQMMRACLCPCGSLVQASGGDGGVNDGRRWKDEVWSCIGCLAASTKDSAPGAFASRAAVVAEHARRVVLRQAECVETARRIPQPLYACCRCILSARDTVGVGACLVIGRLRAFAPAVLLRGSAIYWGGRWTCIDKKCQHHAPSLLPSGRVADTSVCRFLVWRGQQIKLVGAPPPSMLLSGGAIGVGLLGVTPQNLTLRIFSKSPSNSNLIFENPVCLSMHL